MNPLLSCIGRGRPGVSTLVLLGTLAHATLTGSRVAVSLGALASGMTGVELGLLLACHSLLPTLGSIRIGRWIDRAGARVPALTGMTVLCIGLAISAGRPASATLWITALLVGGGYAITVLALQSQIGRLERAGGGRGGFSTFALGTAISGSVGPALAGECLARSSLGATFGVLATIGLTSLAGMTFLRTGLAAGGSDRPGMPGPRIAVRRLLGDPGLRRVLAADLLMAIAWNANTFILPLHGHRLGWSAAVVGDLLGVFGAAVFAVRALPSAMTRRIGDWQAIRLALASSGACFLALPATDRLPLQFLLQAVMGLGLGGALASVLALLHARAPQQDGGAVLGMRLVALHLSALALPLGLGGLGAVAGLAGFMKLLGAGLCASAAGLAPPPPEPGEPASKR